MKKKNFPSKYNINKKKSSSSNNNNNNNNSMRRQVKWNLNPEWDG
jgi:hypothetical protein